MKVLILTGRFGMGHVSVAKSLEEQILGEYSDVSAEVIDLMEYTAPHAANFIYGAFALLAKHGRSLYNFIYKQAGRRDENEWTAFTAFSMRKLTALLEEKRPDVVISTLPFCSLLVSKYKERTEKNGEQGRKPVILVTCITDISSHSEWIQPNTDFYLVGGDLVKRQLVSKGVAAKSIIITGIPVRRAFSEKSGQPAEEATADRSTANRSTADRSTANRSTEDKRLLIMGGGLGLLPKSPDFYEKLNAMNGVKTTVIAGKNEKLYHMLAGRYDNIEAVGYTDRVDLYMKRADVVLTKPGGITLFETIFSGKPILMFSPFLQQEVNNMHFALYHNIGQVLSRKQGQWAKQIQSLMADDKMVAQMSSCVARLREEYDQDGLRQVLGRSEAFGEGAGGEASSAMVC